MTRPFDFLGISNRTALRKKKLSDEILSCLSPLIFSTNALKGLILDFRKIRHMNMEIYGNKLDVTSSI